MQNETQRPSRASAFGLSVARGVAINLVSAGALALLLVGWRWAIQEHHGVLAYLLGSVALVAWFAAPMALALILIEPFLNLMGKATDTRAWIDGQGPEPYSGWLVMVPPGIAFTVIVLGGLWFRMTYGELMDVLDGLLARL